MCSTPKHGCQIFPLVSKHFAYDLLRTGHICLSLIKIIIKKNNKENQYLLDCSGCNMKLHVQCEELEFLHKGSRRLVTLLNDLNQHCPFGWKTKVVFINCNHCNKKAACVSSVWKELRITTWGSGFILKDTVNNRVIIIQWNWRHTILTLYTKIMKLSKDKIKKEWTKNYMK